MMNRGTENLRWEKWKNKMENETDQESETAQRARTMKIFFLNSSIVYVLDCCGNLGYTKEKGYLVFIE